MSSRAIPIGRLVAALFLLSVVPGVPRAQDDRGADTCGALYGSVIGRIEAIGAAAELDPVTDAGIRTGDLLTAELARKAIRRLWDTGDYADVRVSARRIDSGQVLLILTVATRMRLVRIDIEGESSLESSDLEKAAGFFPDMPVDEDRLKEMVQKILLKYRDAGLPDASASARHEPAGERGRVRLVLTVNEGRPLLIGKIRIQGLDRFAESDLLDAAGLKEGGRFDRQDVDDARKKIRDYLRERNHYECQVSEAKANPRPDRKMDLVFSVTEGDHFAFVFEGNRNFRVAALLEVLQLEQEEHLSPEVLADFVERIEKHYVLWGFLDVQVSSRSEKPRKGQRVVRFIIQEGPQVEVDRIEFEGNERFSDDALSREVFAYMEEKIARSAVFQPLEPGTLNAAGISGGQGSATSHPSPLPLAPDSRPGRVYSEEMYHGAIDRLKTLYASKGYLDAQIGDLKPVRSEDRTRITVHLTVKEGTETLLQTIRFQGNRSVASGDLIDVADLEVEEPLSMQKVEEARRRIADHYGSLGYIYASVSFKDGIRFSQNRRFAEVTFAVDEGPQVRVDKIVIRGNTLTSKSLILDRLTFGEGDIYTPNDAEESKRHLMQLGIFDSVTIEPYRAEEPSSQKTILVLVREHKPQMLEFKPGFSTGKGARASFEYAYRDIFGYAVEARLLASVNYRLFFIGQPDFESAYEKLPLADQLERRLLLGIGVPNLPGMGAIAGVRLDASEERVNEPYFGAEKVSGYLTVQSRYFKAVNLETATGLERSNIQIWVDFCAPGETPAEANCIDASSSLQRNPKYQWLRLPQADNAVFWVSRAEVGLDLRDNPFTPKSGFYATASYEYVRSVWAIQVGNEYLFSNLGRIMASASGYIPIAGLVLALNVQYGLIHHLQDGSTTFPDRYFYLGGINDVRGFPEESMHAADADKVIVKGENQKITDQERLRVLGGETMIVFRAELRIPIVSGFSLGVFSDAGNIWRKPDDFKIWVLRPTAGLGIRYQTPVGPLAFDYGFNLDREPGEDPGAFHFSIGLF